MLVYKEGQCKHCYIDAYANDLKNNHGLSPTVIQTFVSLEKEKIGYKKNNEQWESVSEIKTSNIFKKEMEDMIFPTKGNNGI